MIEIATKQDHPEITEVWELSVRATHHFLTETDIQFFKPLILNEYLDAVRLFCTRDKANRIIGFLGLSDDKIEMLFLHPDARGKGIGKLLLQFATNDQQIHKVDVNEQNEQAVGFYQHMGFRVVHRSPVDGMGKPFPILSMELDK
ncbi:MAG: GNAT family N-acetyltransferase [Chitinophagaceae bacterium]